VLRQEHERTVAQYDHRMSELREQLAAQQRPVERADRATAQRVRPHRVLGIGPVVTILGGDRQRS
jgi:hypothetical protein